MNHYLNLSLENIVEYIDEIGWITEEWFSIKGYEGLYQVSTFGRIKSLRRKCHHYRGEFIRKEKIRKQNLSKYGYCRVHLSKNDKIKVHCVHVLLAEIVHPNPEKKPEVNHIDTDKQNNRYINLEWATRSENMQHAVAMGLMNPTKGESNNFAKLKNEEVLEIFHSKESGIELASKYNVSEKHISQIKRGFRWRHLTGKEYSKKKFLSKELREKIKNESGPQKDIMKKYSISRSLLYQIKSGRSWRDIEAGLSKAQEEEQL